MGEKQRDPKSNLTLGAIQDITSSADTITNADERIEPIMEIKRGPEPQVKVTQLKEWKPISILQAINLCLCTLYFPYLLTYTLYHWGWNLWLAGAGSWILGIGIFLLLYQQTRHIKLFDFD